jgi:hypothetical protein
MAIVVNYWARRDNASIEALGSAAYEYCRALCTQEGVSRSRFYWVNADTIVVQSEGSSFEVFDRPATPEVGRALFGLNDLARAAGSERWMDPKEATEVYRRAGR